MGDGSRSIAPSFEVLAVEAFSFLRNEGYSLVFRSEHCVRFRRGECSVKVVHDVQSFELGVELCRDELIPGEPRERCLHLGYFVWLVEGGKPSLWPSPAATEADAIGRLVFSLAQMTQGVAMPTIRGDIRQFDAAARIAEHAGVALREGWAAARLREKADSAWRTRDFAGVVAAYDEMEALSSVTLRPSERGRLVYARRRAT